MEDQLKYIFSLVNDWLKFAEAKNAVIIGFAGAATFGVVSNYDKFSVELKIWLPIFFLLIIASFLNSLLSFMPVLNKHKTQTQKKKETDNKSNFLFFGDLKNFKNESELLKTLYISKAKQVPIIFSEWELNFANQIITNSKIAFLKYTYFKRSCLLAILAILIPVILWMLTAFLVFIGSY